jgi:mono/diheme cytochrome c family protein
MMSARIATAARLGIAALALTVTSAAFGLQAPTGSNGTPATPPAAAAAAAATPTAGRELFANWGCGSCHALADAGGTGHVGPSFDGNKNLTEKFVVDRVTNGQGAMPAFGGQMTDEEIATIAAYIVRTAAK